MTHLFSFKLVTVNLIISVILAGTACSTTEEATIEEREHGQTYQPYLELITSEFLKEQIYYFAGDDMEGRGTGTDAKERAAEYLANFQEDLGLTPAGENDSFFQPFELDSRRLDHIAFHAWKIEDEDTVTVDESILRPGQTANFSRVFGGENPADGQVVFAGFGALDQDRDINHLDKDLSGKWVMVFDHIPHKVDGDTLVSPDYGNQARFNEIMFQQGAAGILVITTDDAEEYEQESLSSGYELEQPVSLGLPYRSTRDRFQGAYMSVSPEMAARFLDIDQQALSDKKQQIKQDISGFSPYLTDYHLESHPEVIDEVIVEQNVAAMLEGSDSELKDEVIVITAHYDHLGVGAPDDTGDRIYNGADDNASGSMGMLAAAKALKQAKEDGNGLDRSVLFLHVAAEEWGLLGSRYFSDHSTVPIDDIVANINMDMIGRWDETHEAQNDSSYIYIIGAEIISSDLNTMLEQASEWSADLNLNMRYNDLDDPNQFYRRSDHWSLGRLEIPFIFFFSGVHEDYHQPGDTPDKILYETLTDRVRLITATMVEIANAPFAPEIDSQEFLRRTE